MLRPVRVSLAFRGDRVIDAGFDAHGCGAATAAGSAAVTLVRGGSVLDAARIGAARSPPSWAGSAGQAPCGRTRRGRAARALGAAVRERAALAAPARRPRMLVAMSGGVDSAVAALLSSRAGETVAVTLELWSDRGERRRAKLLFVLRGCPGARARALDGPRALHDRPARRVPRRRGAAVHRLFAAGETPNPCVGCNGHVRLDAMLEVADRLGAARLATGHYARVAEIGHHAGPLLRAAVDRRQGPDLYVRRAVARARSRGCVPARGADQARGQESSRRGRACRSRARPTPRICASSPARPRAASWPATAAWRRRGGDRRRRRERPRPPRWSASVHGRPAARNRDRRRRAPVRARQGRGPQRGHRRSQIRAPHDRRVAVRECAPAAAPAPASTG